MNYQDITIATITLARNENEEAELKESLQQLALLNIPVTIADGGSVDSFINFLLSIPRFTIVPQKSSGVWQQARASVKAAHQSNTSYILYTEPDKKDFFSNGLPRFLKEATANEASGIIMASRSGEGFSSFPPFQQMTETTINNCCAEITGKKTDYCYGPFLFNKTLVSSLEKVTEDIGWGWRPYLFASAYHRGYTIDAFVDDYRCPVQQSQDDAKERLYRMKQLEQNIRGLVLAANRMI